MPKFLFLNRSEKTISLGIEPWADVEELADAENVEFEYTEPAVVEIVVHSDGTATVVVDAERVVFRAKGRERTFDGPFIGPYEKAG